MHAVASFADQPADLVAGKWKPIPGAAMQWRNPARPDQVVWSGSPEPAHVEQAIEAARMAFLVWSKWPRERRYEVLRHFQKRCTVAVEAMASLICDETGKVMWDARAEAGLLGAKVDITLDEDQHGGLARVRPFDLELSATRQGRCWFRPHGVMAVLGPFNFPAHLPNGHIVPALAMGNTIVFKPSDKAPGVGQLLARLLQEALDDAGAPPGVVNLVQGGPEVARLLVSSEGLDGILFTGSWPVGRAILAANLDRPGRIIALEMGGNNPAVVLPDADLKQAAIECVRSAFVTTGQRCTCTRRVIVHQAAAAAFIPLLQKLASTLIVGPPRAEHPVFMGPVISGASRDAVLGFQAAAAARGGRILLESSRMELEGGGHFLTPWILEVERFTLGSIDPMAPMKTPGDDLEIFGPMLRVSIASSVDDALEQANATRFGLAASIFTHDDSAVARFTAEAKAGCINVNTGTAGASSKLPFGGLGLSGNHRPAGAFSLDYCAYPVAGMVEVGASAQMLPGMHFEEAWVPAQPLG